MAVDAAGAAVHHAIADPGGAGDPDARDNAAMAADAHVVADLDLVIDLGAFAYHRVIHGAAIDGRIGADLDIVLDDHPADLDDFQHARGTRRIAEAILPDPRAVMDDHIIADQRRDNARSRGNGAAAADLHIRADQRACAYRTEKRRVGTACVGTRRSRGSPYTK